jgi:hypothetical protein
MVVTIRVRMATISTKSSWGGGQQDARGDLRKV